MERFQLPTLLIVSDNPPVRYWLKKHLEKQFYIIDAAKKARALEVVQYTALDFIIVDSGFEDCDALELCRALRQFNLLTPILLITGRLKKTYRESALDAGVTDFLFDQLDSEELETRIATGLKAAELRHKVAGLSGHIPIARPELSSEYFKNKFLLQTQALELLANAREHALPVTLVILRIDQYPKLVGKEILLPFSELLNENITEKELLIPINDGQYILLLCQNLEGGKKTAVKIREKIQERHFDTEKGPLRVTATFAISDLEDSNKSFNEMIDSAVKALKQADTVTNTILSIEKRSL
jgi:PleD family two-component response regulator